MIAAICFAALLPGTAAWNVPADLVREQYAELRTWFEKQAPAPEFNPREIGAVHRFLAPKPVETRLDSTAVLVEWPLMQIGSAPSTRGSSRTQVRFYGVRIDAPGQGPHAAAVVLGAKPGSVALPSGVTALYVVCAADGAHAQPWVSDRAWLFRLATQSGHHLIGTEAQLAIAAADYLTSLASVDRERIELIGAGAGASPAQYAAALDARFHRVTLQHPSGSPYAQPEDRMIWKRGVAFPDPAAARKIAPRAITPTTAAPAAPDPLTAPWPQLRRAYLAQFRQWEAWYRNAALELYATRGNPSLDQYLEQTGRFPAPAGPLDARSALAYDTAEVEGHRIRVQVYDGVHATGILLIPKSFDRTRRHPLVFVQHGLGGLPEDALGVDDRGRQDEVYRKFGLQLARRGYLVFAPMISTQSGDERTSLVRRAHPAGLTPTGVERVKFSRLLDFFSTLPFVDAERFGFYGLSYGGYTALWTTPGEPRFKVVVSSGHFNDWSTKTTDPTLGTSYLFYPDHLDMYNHGMLARFNHAGLASLIAPRPLLIEMGSQDGVMVAPRGLVDSELEHVASAYRAAGFADRFEVARFDGPHRIDGPRAFAFIDRWLR